MVSLYRGSLATHNVHAVKEFKNIKEEKYPIVGRGNTERSDQSAAWKAVWHLTRRNWDISHRVKVLKGFAVWQKDFLILHSFSLMCNTRLQFSLKGQCVCFSSRSTHCMKTQCWRRIPGYLPIVRPSLVKVCSVVFVYSCWQTNKPTDRHRWKHNPCSKLFNRLWRKKSVDTFSEVITLVWYLSLFQRGDVSHILPTVSPTKHKTPSQLSFLRV